MVNSIDFRSKFPQQGASIFSKMTRLAREHNAINLAQGYPNYDCDQALKDCVNSYIEQGYNQYAPMQGSEFLRTEISHLIEASYDFSIDPNLITLTAGATQAIFTAIQVLVKQGDEVIVIDPSYDSYKPSIRAAGGTPISYQIPLPNLTVDWNELGSLISEKTTMIIINTPHNPTGMMLSKEDLDSLYTLIQDTQITVLSDEVYEYLTYDSVKHYSVLQHDGLRERSIATYSFGKMLHCTGWKIGYAIAPEWITQELRKLHQFVTFCVNTPMQYGIANYLKHHKERVKGLGQFYQAKKELLESGLQNSRLQPLPTAGTYYKLYRYDSISNQSDIDFTLDVIKSHGVALLPISVFSDKPSDGHYVRICFAKTEDTLTQACERLCQL